MSAMTHTRESRLRRIADGARAHDATGRLRGRAVRGFTLFELMAVIAILAIMAGIGFVSISQIQKNMQQTELDGTAKELFIAAQNHLTTANAEGTLARKTDKGVAVEGKEGVYYYAVNGSTDQRLVDSSSAAQTSVLYQMLPFGSIDETVRTGGTYVIEYNLDSAQVLGVFYARSSYSSMFAANTDGFAFTDADYAKLFPGYEGAENAQARQNYASTSGATVMVGYYGGEDLDSLRGQQIAKPRLRVDNAERLTATITNPNDLSTVTSLQLSLRLIVTGVTSGKSKAITLIDKGNVAAAAGLSYVDSVAGGSRYVVQLDDVTTANGGFVNIFGGDGLIPGEDVRIQAVMSSTTALTNVAKSASMRRNSLFGSVYSERETTGGSTTTTRTARISNMRHLENLSYNVSGYDPSTAVGPASTTPNANPAASWSTFAAKSAMQASDLSWAEFCRAINFENPTGVQVYQHAAGNVPTAAGTFMPILPDKYELSYDGRNHRITDVAVQRSSGGAGLFESLKNGSVKDLDLVNFNVSTTSGDAGALAGATEGTAISGVAAYNELSDDKALGITGSGSAGGLVGAMTGGSINNSAAAAYVQSTSGNAGGLVGQVSDATAISSSYAGGHTANGRYTDSTVAGVAGRMNVIAAGNAGGLVGNAANGALSVNSCYSTASAYGNVAGGLIGYANDETVNNSYAIGRVIGANGSAAGALVGQMDGGALTNCTYLETVNNDMDAVGAGTATATAADSDLAAYNAFTGNGAMAYPYDGILVSRYQGVYSYKTIADLTGASAGSALPLHLTSHYGDWPVVETMVVNARS